MACTDYANTSDASSALVEGKLLDAATCGYKLQINNGELIFPIFVFGVGLAASFYYTRSPYVPLMFALFAAPIFIARLPPVAATIAGALLLVVGAGTLYLFIQSRTDF